MYILFSIIITEFKSTLKVQGIWPSGGLGFNSVWETLNRYYLKCFPAILFYISGPLASSPWTHYSHSIFACMLTERMSEKKLRFKKVICHHNWDTITKQLMLTSGHFPIEKRTWIHIGWHLIHLLHSKGIILKRTIL